MNICKLLEGMLYKLAINGLKLMQGCLNLLDIFFFRHNLKILGLISSDAGMFQCIGSNPAGTIQHSARLQIIQEISGLFFIRFIFVLNILVVIIIIFLILFCSFFLILHVTFQIN